MASGAAALALKAAVVTAVLAVLVLPSLGRCPSLGPEPPTPVPAPTSSPGPAPGPPISCDDCRSQCYSNCSVSTPLKCSNECNTKGWCEQCRTEVINQCTACCNAGTCGCDCNAAAAAGLCASACSDRSCGSCLYTVGKHCEDDCRNSDCNGTCV